MLLKKTHLKHLSFPTLFDGHYLGNRLRLEDKRYPKKSFSFLVIFFFGCAVHIVFSIASKVFLPVNNSLIDYPVKRYDRAFELASDVINENFTARFIFYFLLISTEYGLKPFLASLRLGAFAWNLLTLLTPSVFVSFWLY